MTDRHEEDGRQRMQEVIGGAVDWLAWILRYPQNPVGYPEAVTWVMAPKARGLSPLSPRDVDRATSWLANFLWQMLLQGGGMPDTGDEEEVILFQTNENHTPCESLRLMGEEIGLSAEQLGLRLPAYLCARIAPSGEGVVDIWRTRYAQLLSPTLSLAPGRALVSFQVPLSEPMRAVLRDLGAVFVADDRFIDLLEEEQRWRMALAEAADAYRQEEWELHLPPAQGGTKTGAHLYRVFNASSTASWQPWLAWVLSQRSTDFPHEPPRERLVRGGRREPKRTRDEEERLLHGCPAREISPSGLVSRLDGEERPRPRQEEEEDRGPFAHQRRHLAEELTRFTHTPRDEELLDIAALVRSLEGEGALERWQLVVEALEASAGREEAQRVATFYLGIDVPTVAMLAYALTGRSDLVLPDEGEETAPLLPEIPPRMAWVWAIPLADLEGATRAKSFMDFAGLFHLQERYRIAFLFPNGQPAPYPLLYGITPASQARDQFHWLATGEGYIPL